jgi:hypothetical protein
MKCSSIYDGTWSKELRCNSKRWSLTEHHATKAYWGSEIIAPRILNLGTRWELVVSFTRRLLLK